MPKFSDRIRNLLTRHVDQRGLVVWYDPERAYERFAADLELPDTAVLRYQEGFFRLRCALEPHLEFVTPEGRPRDDCGVPPRVVVYVPMAREEAGHALVEAETAGTVLEPGAPDPERNTRLRAQAEAFFAQVAPERAAHVARQVDEGVLTLEDLDRLADEVGSLASGALKLVFANASPLEALLEFLASPARDAAIRNKNALPELLDLARKELGVDPGPARDPAEARVALQRAVLLAEFASALPEPARPAALAAVPLPESAAQLSALRHLCDLWRNRSDLAEAYAEAARRVEAEAGIGEMDLPEEHIAGLDTFRSLEVRRILAAEARLEETGAAGRGGATGGEGAADFWPRQEPALAMRRRAAELAGELLGAIEWVRGELDGPERTAAEMVRAYASHARPWMTVDRLYRHWEARVAAIDPEESGGPGRFEALAARVRREYAALLDRWARVFLWRLEQGGFQPDGVPGQDRVFADHVAPALRQGERVAYLLVDALRYEMGAELAEGLSAEAEVSIDPVMGCLPGVTAVGMAALLPGAERGLEVEAGPRRMLVSVAGRPVRDRAARLERLAEAADGAVAVFRLSEVLRLGAKRKKELAAARLVVVTSQEIDRLGETGHDLHELRRWMDDVLDQLRRAVRVLLRNGVDRVVVAADHGHLLVDELDPGLGLDPPGGDTAEIHSRVWVGRGGAATDAAARVAASELGVGGDLEFVFPRGLASFRLPGAGGGFLHGGVSLQEVVVPVLRVRSRGPAGGGGGKAKVRLTSDRPSITNRFFSVTAVLEPAGLFGPEELRVRAEVLAGRAPAGECAMAAYGFDEGSREVTLCRDKPNRLTFLLTAEAPAVSVRLTDCATGLVVGTLAELPVDLTL